MSEQSGISGEVLWLAHAQHDHNNYSRFIKEIGDVRLINYWRRRTDHALLQKAASAKFVPFYSYNSPSTCVLLDYKVLKASVEEIDELEIKAACAQLCVMFGGESTSQLHKYGQHSAYVMLCIAVACFLDWTRKYGIKAKVRPARAYSAASSSAANSNASGTSTNAGTPDDSSVRPDQTILHQSDTALFKAGGVASIMNEHGIILAFVSHINLLQIY